MKKILAIIIVLLTVSSGVRAQSGWFRVLSSAVKAGQAITLTDEELSETVADGVKMLDQQNRICGQNSAYTKRLKRLTGGMTDANGIKLNFKVYQTREVNAFACPDGSVRVYSAMMDALTDNELLGVLGHEIGHVALRHAKKAWRSALLRSAASDLAGAVSSTWADLSDSFLGDLTSLALSAKHTRWHETQADDFGYDFLKRCGKNPWAMAIVFEKLKQLAKQGDNSKYNQWLQAFSSHPNFDERISRMSEKAKADGFVRP